VCPGSGLGDCCSRKWLTQYVSDGHSAYF
jgi:hypothetical protein